MLSTWPIPSYGGSTGLAPIQVSSRVVATSIQNVAFFFGSNFLELDLFPERIIKYATDMARAITPPSLEGMERRMA